MSSLLRRQSRRLKRTLSHMKTGFRPDGKRDLIRLGLGLGSIATGNRHGGPHKHAREIARHLRQAGR